MGTVKSFNQFINEAWKDVDNSLEKKAVGVAVVYNNKILMVHPTSASWRKATLGIPKGKLEQGEDILTGAIRELREETGIDADPRILAKSEPHVVDLYDKSGNIEKQLIYFLYEISDLSEIGLQTERVPKSQLQSEEVDWAGFMGPNEAYPMTNRNQLIILDRHLNI
jgi:8-oxo-dGTP pyrophosphatase MutT (NUDIX family)